MDKDNRKRDLSWGDDKRHLLDYIRKDAIGFDDDWYEKTNEPDLSPEIHDALDALIDETYQTARESTHGAFAPLLQASPLDLIPVDNGDDFLDIDPYGGDTDEDDEDGGDEYE